MSQLPTGSAPQRLARSPPFRHEHVGSFLRPTAIHEARGKYAEGQISEAELRQVEDEQIRIHLDKLQAHGIQDLTDGEFRRKYFHIDFLKHLGGVKVQTNTLEQQQGAAPPTLTVTSRIHHVAPIEVRNFEFLKSLVPPEKHAHIKITIPSPTMLHFRGGRKAISEQVYPDLDDFFRDVAAAYRTEVDALYKAGCRYLQMDDTNLAYLTDPRMREEATRRGEDVAALPKKYARLINACFADRPTDMVIGIHLCKGNFRSQFFAAGSEEGYAPVAEALFGDLNVDAYFLEWEDSRSGVDFSALKNHVSEHKTIVLGLVSSKRAQLEDSNILIQKLNDAASQLPRGLDQLAISPQCGFSSTVHGNDITEEHQFAKLKLCADVAEKVWGAF